jgi:hypothetical protein
MFLVLAGPHRGFIREALPLSRFTTSLREPC